MKSIPMNFAFEYGGPINTVCFRECDEDFIVIEELGWEPEGEGEHVYLDISKTGENTEWVAKQIARYAGVSIRDIGFCGLKDRRAVTRQWFSIYAPKLTDFDWSGISAIDNLNVELHSVSRGKKKLRRGDHKANHFVIRLKGIAKADEPLIEQRLAQISEAGVPNYFGEQRFGRDGNNLVEFEHYASQERRQFRGKNKSMLMSAGRSYLFNCVLSQRVAGNTWRQALSGEPSPDQGATGPLWGRGRPLAGEETAVIEADSLAAWQGWCDALEHVGLSQERRMLQLRLENLQYQLEDDQLVLAFALQPGQYATAVLRELFILDQPDRNLANGN